MITRQALKLNWEGTNRVLQAAIRKVQEMGIPMSISVVDEGGHLLGFARTDQGKIHNIRVAHAKARAAASNRLPTGKVSSSGQPVNDHMAIALPLAAGTDMYVTFAGGLPILVEGHCVGGVGVSGGTGEQDTEVARAGIDALAAA
ncbi:MAG TPA: heme-binding protein [Candidatus Methylomirabilis sp.]|nr:heme-binding protein [Candidatus Methylomirabilis sp.]